MVEAKRGLKNVSGTLRVEFHCHTRYSKDCLTDLEALAETCRRKSIDRLVVTDHNTVEGALEAVKLFPQLFIPGVEVKTDCGELLAAFIKEEVPNGLPPLEAIAHLRRQGAFISIPHPFDSLRTGSWRLQALQEIAPLVDAIEVFNSRCIFPWMNWQAQAFARRHRLPGIVGSDAHTLAEVGRSTLLLASFNDASSLRTALPYARSQVRSSGFWVHAYSRQAALEKMPPGTD
jgi:predicted metal-dependent phosphoesterase TrpH